MLTVMRAQGKFILVLSIILLVASGGRTLRMAGVHTSPETPQTHSHVHEHDGHVHVHTHTHGPIPNCASHESDSRTPHENECPDWHWCHDHHGAIDPFELVLIARVRTATVQAHIPEDSFSVLSRVANGEIDRWCPDVRARPPDHLSHLRSVILLT
ncbi:MAG: hypothetical protein MK100_05700 [Phycisphaerales bacterium]|nr:hypothetical protein [Phycisphaerales bacterium]